VDALPAVRKDARTWAAEEVVAADPDQRDAVAAAVAEAGTWHGTSELGAGTTWFAHGAARFRLQTQFVF